MKPSKEKVLNQLRELKIMNGIGFGWSYIVLQNCFVRAKGPHSQKLDASSFWGGLVSEEWGPCPYKTVLQV